jgi:5-methylcytosine-specific restriction endonuclease McrA
MRQFKRKKKVELKEGEVRPPKKIKKPITSQDDPRFRTMIMSALRGASRWWHPAQACIAKARTGRGEYTCPVCNGKFKQKEMKRDHVDPVIPVTGFVSWDSVVKRMFEQEEAYQGICKTCHAAKTLEENRERRRLAKQKAVLQLEENSLEHDNEDD